MKSTTASALILALIMLLLVLVAAFVFLFQGRQTLLQDRADLNTEVSELHNEVSQTDIALQAAEGTRIATQSELATAVADAVLLEGQLVESQQAVDNFMSESEALAGELQEMTGTATALSVVATAAAGQLPEVRFIAPEAAGFVPVGQTIPIVVVAADPAGITAVNLSLNGEPFASFDGNDASLVVQEESWTPTEAGTAEFSLMAINSRGRASDPTTLTVMVNPATGANTALEQIEDPSRELRATIEANVSHIRGLTPTTPVTTTLLTGDELRRRLEEDLLSDFSEMDAFFDYVVLHAFDLLPADYDLYTTTIDLYGEQIAGFYDPETDEFVVISEDAELDAAEQLTHAHEYMHALQDQYFNLDRFDDETRDADADRALLALIEGEATLIQSLYLLEGFVDINDVFTSLEGLETPVLDKAPPILGNRLLFPYNGGLEFAQTLYSQAGFDGLDTAWEDIPQSTEQILHPERYLGNDFPQLVSLPPLTDTLGSGWLLAGEDVFGEFMLREYLSQQLNENQLDTAATGWGGDRYAVYHQPADNQTVMVLRLVWDTDDDATEFAALYPNYPANLFESGGQLQGDGGECWQGALHLICLFQNGRETLIIRAPDLETVMLVNEAIADS